MVSYRRQTAHLCTLATLKKSAYRQPGDGTAGGVEAAGELIGRINVMGVVVEKTSEDSFTLDDGTTTMRCMRFDEKELDCGVGDLVLVIGKPREYDDERYIVIEICKRLANRGWVAYRKRELAAFAPTQKGEAAPMRPADAIVEAIRANDKGSGADTEEVLAAAKLPDGERILEALMREGDVFEARPGKLKILE